MNKRYLFLSIFFLIVYVIFARGGRDTQPQPRLVRAEGIVRLTGSSLFPEIVITGENTQWHVNTEEAYKLRDLQHRFVIVEGEETIIDMESGGGVSIGIRRNLRNIRIISVDE